MKLTETLAVILERLIEAMETDIALPIRVGPKQFGSAMPEYVHTQAEVFATQREDIAETMGQRTAFERKAVRAKLEKRRRCSAERISRMEETFEWVRKWIFDEEARQMLLAYAEVKARGWSWTKYVSNRNRRNPKKRAWVRQNCYRLISKSLQIIEQQIAKGGFFLHNGEALPMRQIEPKHECKSIRSDLRSWTASEEKPAA
ncbi:hypothetical protein [Agrobacterium rubi]|uniref:Uncharacterized protein n=1 Tax=Agrobacterium rubi TaxID=28099 RepID=A0ABX2J372_9HYPH|nr:hypothetical protein [Agrobacterium rubi]NTF35546.1 hypothetical protein [Agrobacterium rubi]